MSSRSIGPSVLDFELRCSWNFHGVVWRITGQASPPYSRRLPARSGVTESILDLKYIPLLIPINCPSILPPADIALSPRHLFSPLAPLPLSFSFLCNRSRHLCQHRGVWSLAVDKTGHYQPPHQMQSATLNLGRRLG